MVASVKGRSGQLENLKCFSLIWKWHWIVCSSWLLILLAVYFLPCQKSDCVHHIILQEISSSFKKNPDECKCTCHAGFSRGLLCNGLDSIFFVCCLSRQKQQVMIVIITTQLLANILPANSLVTLGGLNTWEKSITRKSNSCPQCEPDLGERSVSPA